jgi:hypothetical protein
MQSDNEAYSETSGSQLRLHIRIIQEVLTTFIPKPHLRSINQMLAVVLSHKQFSMLPRMKKKI